MRKSTYESRMKSYMVMVVMIGIFLTLWTGYLWLENNTRIIVGTMDRPTIEEVDLLEVSDVKPFTKILILSRAEQIKATSADTIPVETIQPDDYDGKIVIASAAEVITMTIDNDGIKHFTNHLIG